MKRIRRILHPSDFSPSSRAAFARSVEMAKANRAELVVAHVLAPIVLPGDGDVSPHTSASSARRRRGGPTCAASRPRGRVR
jgi:nucleotide-binding universal stress UspA family protein